MKRKRRKVFSCRQCGECCHGEKGIIVAPREVRRMARYLKIPEEEFIFLYLVPSPFGLQLDSEGGRCVMLEGTLCRVHPVKPLLCRLWPYIPALLNDPEEFELAKQACPGLDPEAEHRQFVEEARRQKMKWEDVLRNF